MLVEGSPRIGAGESPVVSDKIKVFDKAGSLIGMDSTSAQKIIGKDETPIKPGLNYRGSLVDNRN